MKQTIKTLALITAGLVVGAAIGRGKKVKPHGNFKPISIDAKDCHVIR